jgi:methylmalonyl-CoA mutase C-terminal domain/subunit
MGKIRVIVAKVGLDGHDRGAKVVARALRDGAHMTLFRRVIDLLAERGAADIVVFGGGIIPDEDIGELNRMGVAAIFTPGAPTSDIVTWVRAELGHDVAESQT